MEAKHKSLSENDIEEALTSPTYRRILAATIERPCSVKDICGGTGLPMASVYRNIKELEAGGLVMVERSAMTSDGKPYDMYRARINQAALKLSAKGVEVSWTVNLAIEDRILHIWNYIRG